MTNTLKAFLSKEKLRDMAGGKVYARGADYNGRDLVDLLFYEPRETVADFTGPSSF